MKTLKSLPIRFTIHLILYCMLSLPQAVDAATPVISNLVVEQLKRFNGDPDDAVKIKFRVFDPDGDLMSIRVHVVGEGFLTLADSNDSLEPFTRNSFPSSPGGAFTSVPSGDYEIEYQTTDLRPSSILGDPNGFISVRFEITADDGTGTSPDWDVKFRRTGGDAPPIEMVQIEDQGIWMSQNEVTYEQYDEVLKGMRDLNVPDESPEVEYMTQWEAFSQEESGDANYVRSTEAVLVWLNILSELERGEDEWVYMESRTAPYQNEQAISNITVEKGNEGYRLPTVEEWMIACRAADAGVPLNDMGGNLSELCWDESNDYAEQQEWRPVVACGGDFMTGPLECVVNPQPVIMALDGRTAGLRLVTKTRPRLSSGQESIRIAGTTGIRLIDSGWVSLFVAPQVELRYRIKDLMVVKGEALEIKAGVESLRADEVTTQWFLKSNNSIGRRALGDVPLQDGGNISGAHTDRLTISNVTSAMTGNQYYAVVTPKDTGILPARTQILTLQVADTPELKLGVATGTPDWRWSSGGHAPFIYDNETYSEAREDPVATSLIGGQQVTVIQTTIAGPGTLSFSWELTLPSGELLALQKQMRYELLVDGREVATLTEVARVPDPNDPLDKFKSPFIRETNIEGIEIPAGTHRLMWSFVNNSPEGSAQVGALLYDVEFEASGPPSIAVEPVRRLVLPLGDMTYFYVGAGGEDLEYQWFEKFIDGILPMENQLGPWLILPDHTAVAGPSSFIATVSNSLGSVESRQAVLNVYLMEELVRALDNSSLKWETGGDQPWYPDRDGSLARYGGDSAMSNEIGDFGSSWIETKVTGPITLAFDWSVSSEKDFDFLRFFIDDAMQDEISGDQSWNDADDDSVMVFQTKQYQIPDGLHTVRWAYQKDPIDIDPVHNDQGYLDNVRLYAPGALKEALGDTALEWETGGDAPWTPDKDFSKDGISAVRSGSILRNNTTWIQTAVTGPGTLNYKWLIAAHADPKTSNGARLDFYIDEINEKSMRGVYLSWQESSIEIPAGDHILKWEYKKDNSPVDWADAAWLDQVSFSKFVVVQPPQITRQPEPKTVSVGDSVTFTVSATGVPELNYQWKKDGQTIDGAVQNSYTIGSVQDSDAGTYTVEVSDSLESVTSAEAELKVDSLSGPTKPPTTVQTTVFVSPSLFKFEGAFVGQNSSMSLTVLNTGSANLEIVSITSDLGDELVMSETVLTIQPRSAQNITLILSPTTPGPIAGTLTITANTSNSPIEIPITGDVKGSVSPVNGGNPGDFNGDSKADFVWQHTDGTIATWFMDGLNLDGGSLFNPSTTSDLNWQVVGSADFNGDSKPDLIWQHTDGSIAGWLMDGVNLSGGALFNPATPGDRNWRVVSSGDFNGDSKPDLVWQHTNGSIAAWLMDGLNLTGGALFKPSAPSNPSWRIVGSGDFNGDGKPDLVWQHTNGSLAAWFMDGVNLTAGSLFNPSGPGDAKWRIVGVGDYNGDSKPDLVWQHADSSIAIWFMDGVNQIGGGLTKPARSSDVGWKIVGP